MSTDVVIAPSTRTGALGVYHLERWWSAVAAERAGKRIEREGEEARDRVLLDSLGLGLHQTLQYLYRECPSFAEFEDWVVATAGRPDQRCVDRLNAAMAGECPPESVRRWLEDIESAPPALTVDELRFWDENGYVVLRRAVDREASGRAEAAVWRHVGARAQEPESWYRRAEGGIMVELIQHPDLEANRRSARIHKAFSQLWGTADLWVTADRCGFHPPQRPDWPFPGPDLHWDVDFGRPLAFGTQGILYLTDTPAEQGALTLVPGFHRRLAGWLERLGPGVDPQQQDLHALGSRPVPGEAGDMVIWHQSLPHGSRPNAGTRPRIVQYINLRPGPDYAEGPDGRPPQPRR